MNHHFPARLLWALTGFLAALTACLVVVYFTTSSAAVDRQAKRNASLIKDLTAQIELDKASTEADLDAQAATVECVTRFTYAIQAASSDLLVELGQLVVVIATSIPGPEREARVGDGVSKVAAAVEFYQVTVQQRIDYDIAGTPLPCPLAPGLNG